MKIIEKLRIDRVSLVFFLWKINFPLFQHLISIRVKDQWVELNFDGHEILSRIGTLVVLQDNSQMISSISRIWLLVGGSMPRTISILNIYQSGIRGLNPPSSHNCLYNSAHSAMATLPVLDVDGSHAKADCFVESRALDFQGQCTVIVFILVGGFQNKNTSFCQFCIHMSDIWGSMEYVTTAPKFMVRRSIMALRRCTSANRNEIPEDLRSTIS